MIFFLFSRFLFFAWSFLLASLNIDIGDIHRMDGKDKKKKSHRHAPPWPGPSSPPKNIFNRRKMKQT